MGLCKCERKKVTNLFCFEHRVNVCDFCLMSLHPKCVVKSYLHWLKDSDYSLQCILCARKLDNGEECVRLMCLDIFHWHCLDNYASQLPMNTAPAGYECPSCSLSIIPHSNQGGPVAETLRRQLTSVKWFKPNNQIKASFHKNKLTPPPKAYNTLNVFEDSKLLDASVDSYAYQFLQDQEMVTLPSMPSLEPAETIVPIEYSSSTISNGPPTSCVDSNLPSNFNNPRNLLIDDEDTDKYRRHHVPVSKSGSNFFKIARCISSLLPLSLLRYRLTFIFAVITFICLMLLLLTNLMTGQSLPENNLLPIRLHHPVGV